MLEVQDSDFSLMSKQQLCSVIFSQASIICDKLSDQAIMHQFSELASQSVYK